MIHILLLSVLLAPAIAWGMDENEIISNFFYSVAENEGLAQTVIRNLHNPHISEETSSAKIREQINFYLEPLLGDAHSYLINFQSRLKLYDDYSKEKLNNLSNNELICALQRVVEILKINIPTYNFENLISIKDAKKFLEEYLSMNDMESEYIKIIENYRNSVINDKDGATTSEEETLKIEVINKIQSLVGLYPSRNNKVVKHEILRFALLFPLEELNKMNVNHLLLEAGLLYGALSKYDPTIKERDSLKLFFQNHKKRISTIHQENKHIAEVDKKETGYYSVCKQGEKITLHPLETPTQTPQRIWTLNVSPGNQEGQFAYAFTMNNITRTVHTPKPFDVLQKSMPSLGGNIRNNDIVYYKETQKIARS